MKLPVVWFENHEIPGSFVGVIKITEHVNPEISGNYALMFKRPHNDNRVCLTRTENGEDITQINLTKGSAECLYQALKVRLGK
jgi:hypothetical protein